MRIWTWRENRGGGEEYIQAGGEGGTRVELLTIRVLGEEVGARGCRTPLDKNEKRMDRKTGEEEEERKRRESDERRENARKKKRKRKKKEKEEMYAGGTVQDMESTQKAHCESKRQSEQLVIEEEHALRKGNEEWEKRRERKEVEG